MSTRQPKKPRELTPLTVNEVLDIGRQLAYFSQQYERVAAEMDKSSIGSIETKGAANLLLTIDRINGAVQSLQSGLLRARTKGLKPKQPSIAESQADVLAQHEQRKQSKKAQPKKRSSD